MSAELSVPQARADVSGAADGVEPVPALLQEDAAAEPGDAGSPPVPTSGHRRGPALWAATWPKLIAVLLGLGAWQLVVLSGWKPTYLLPPPITVFRQLGTLVFHDSQFWVAIGTTMSRAVTGFATAVAVGTALGLAVSRSRVLRAGLGSMISGLQTMPSITWFPLAGLLFGAGEQAIAFVVVLGAAPSIANGVLSGIDNVPPSFTRLGKVLGAKGWSLYRLVVLPAAMPTYVAGLSQGWAFAWRSLMAGELLVILRDRPSLGTRLGYAQDNLDAPGLLAYMLVILVLGMVASAAFSSLARQLRRRRGLNAD